MAINIKYISGHRWNWQHKNTTHITSIIHSKINKISSLTTFYIKKNLSTTEIKQTIGKSEFLKKIKTSLSLSNCQKIHRKRSVSH